MPPSHRAALASGQSVCSTHCTHMCEPGSQRGAPEEQSPLLRHYTHVLDVVSHFGVLPEQSGLTMQPTHVFVLSLQNGLGSVHLPSQGILPSASASALPPRLPPLPSEPPVPLLPLRPPPSNGEQFA